ncbi:hypothetical protein [Streptomyces decoyicus]|uniref:hypothetical protein n=1 Tax=Streptomyces decoyicus TaxID=249567 RepID=UPI003867FA9A
MPRIRRPLVVAAAALAACTATALTLGTTGPAAAAEAGPRAARHSADAPSLTGSAKLARQPGDNVHFRINAHGFADKAHGTFYVSHHFGKVWGGYFQGRIDCLVTGGPVAVATGIVTASHFKSAPGLPEIGDLRGKRFGFTVLDGGKKGDRLGYSWAMDGVPKNSVGKCLGSAPFETLEKGDYKVHHWTPSHEAAKN